MKRRGLRVDRVDVRRVARVRDLGQIQGQGGYERSEEGQRKTWKKVF